MLNEQWNCIQKHSIFVVITQLVSYSLTPLSLYKAAILTASSRFLATHETLVSQDSHSVSNLPYISEVKNGIHKNGIQRVERNMKIWIMKK